MNASTEILVRMIDQAFDRRSWHGTNLRGSIRGMDASEAAWRPSGRGHNIWEIVVHAAYWKYVVRRRLLGEKRGSFPLRGSNWFERPVSGPGGEAEWQSDVELLVSTHRRLREAAALLTRGELSRAGDGGQVTNFALLTGIAAHDLYHAGQIQLLKRLRAGRRRVSGALEEQNAD